MIKKNSKLYINFGFCDDILLLSAITSELQLLLNICEIYSKNWAIEFNSAINVI